MKRFNTAGTCYPKKHYMVNIDRQVEAAATLVRQGDYFCINRGRQYGKTTTLAALEECLSNEYCVFNISLEGMGDSAFASVETVCAEFLKTLKLYSRVNRSSDGVKTILKNAVPIGCLEINSVDFKEIVIELIDASDKPLVVLIDEVDQASNNDGFIKFLGLLRNMFLSRKKFPTFHSIILAGVYDIKNLKLKIRSDEDHQYNSPWNIAVPFNVPMNLPADGITGMLGDYAKEHDMVMDTVGIGQLIYDYTSGYPFLVSRLCQLIDENDYGWNKEGVLKAVNNLLKDDNPVFSTIRDVINNDTDTADYLQDALSGRYICYTPYVDGFDKPYHLDLILREHTPVTISNRIIKDYLLSFCFNKNKEPGIHEVKVGDRTIIEAIV